MIVVNGAWPFQEYVPWEKNTSKKKVLGKGEY